MQNWGGRERVRVACLTKLDRRWKYLNVDVNTVSLRICEKFLAPFGQPYHCRRPTHRIHTSSP